MHVLSSLELIVILRDFYRYFYTYMTKELLEYVSTY